MGWLRHDGAMPLFRRNRPSAELTAGLDQALGHQPRLLGWGSGPRVAVVATPENFAWRVGEEPWQVVAWEQVRTGGWKSEQSQMWWRLVDGTGEKLVLDDEQSFPGVFRERVQASIALQKRLELEDGSAVLVAARRSPAASDPKLGWDVMPLAGADLEDPAVKAEVDAALAELRGDYDI